MSDRSSTNLQGMSNYNLMEARGMEGDEEFSRYDTMEFLVSEAEVTAYLNEAIEEEDPKLLSAVLDDIAKVRSMEFTSPDTA